MQSRFVGSRICESGNDPSSSECEEEFVMFKCNLVLVVMFFCAYMIFLWGQTTMSIVSRCFSTFRIISLS